MARISSLKARPILDSRGSWTVEVYLKLNDGRVFKASVPQGKSVGSYEASYVPVEAAIKNIQEKIAPKLRGLTATNQKVIDNILNKIDGTPTKRKLGANSTLAVSIAVAKAGAGDSRKPLWKHLRSLGNFKNTGDCPRLFMNVVNGGLHAGNNLDFQEYLVIPKTKSIRESITVGTRFYDALRKYLVKLKGETSSNTGDEGGFAPNFKDNLEPFSILKKVAQLTRLETKVDFGMDAAASDVTLSENKLKSIYKKLSRFKNFIYLEDPFSEDEFKSFADLRNSLGESLLIAGDDLTVTNLIRMEKAYKNKSVNSIIIKPNQIGTVTEAIEAVKLAKNFGWKVIASHRSGETNDDFIADFAYGVGAYGLKLGAPNRGERIAKYNRLLEIEASSD